jgi:hypothetical protein
MIRAPMIQTVFAAALATCTLAGCADYYYDEPSYSRRGGYYEGEVYYGRGDYGRVDGPSYRRDYDYDDYRDRRRGDRGHDRDDDHGKQRMVIEDAQYESVNGKRVDANRYVRDECHNENNCDVKASNKIFGDPDVGAHKDLIVRYRCGKGPSRTMRVPEKSERDIKC